MLLILFVLGGVLMLGGTLTATFLALSDARPDLATLSAVGASPRTRRGVAAAYALVVGFVGAVLGAAVGFIPGIAVTYPLTGVYTAAGGAAKSHYLDIPWLLILALVIGLPLLTALVVGLAARSRLPAGRPAGLTRDVIRAGCRDDLSGRPAQHDVLPCVMRSGCRGAGGPVRMTSGHRDEHPGVNRQA